MHFGEVPVAAVQKMNYRGKNGLGKDTAVIKEREDGGFSGWQQCRWRGR